MNIQASIMFAILTASPRKVKLAMTLPTFRDYLDTVRLRCDVSGSFFCIKRLADERTVCNFDSGSDIQPTDATTTTIVDFLAAIILT